jgi:hypothetical protein
MRVLAFLLAVLLLSGCSKPAEPVAADMAAEIAPAAAPQAEPPTGKATGEVVRAGLVPPPAQAPSAPMLAYRYNYQIAAPPKHVRALAARHEAACVAAGPAICQVTSSQVSAQGEGEVRAELSLRAEPRWLRRFREGLEREARDAGGEVTSAAASSEDLTRQIVDTEAAMRAKTTLRDRLQRLLAERPGKLAELLELERALAEVQGQIDAAQSELAVMRTRVATSAMQIEYASTGISTRPGAWTPLTEALGDAGGMLAASLGVLVQLIVVAAPWAAVAAGLAFLFRGRFRRAARKTPKSPPDAG